MRGLTKNPILGFIGPMGPISRCFLCGASAFIFLWPLISLSEDQLSTKTSLVDLKTQKCLSTQADRSRAKLQFESALYPEKLPGSDLTRMDAIFFDLKYASLEDTRFGFDFISANYTNLPSSFFYLNEAYLGRRISTHTRIDLGRKQEYWADFDREWFLGLWEPRANWDPLRPFEQGLTGVFIHTQLQDYDFLFMASPLFIPTVGPEIAEKNGALVSESRWYRTPSNSGPVLNREVQFFYSLELPEIAHLAQQTSLAGRASYRLGQEGLWYSLAFTRKPMNSLSIQYDYNLTISNFSSQADVRVTPTVSFHDLFTFEVGWKRKNEEVLLSLFSDSVTSPTPLNTTNSTGNIPSDWLQQNPQGIKGGAFKVQSQQDLSLLGIEIPLEIQWSYLHIQTIPSIDRDSLGRERGSLFPDRFNWSEAMQIQFKTKNTLLKKNLTTQFRWMREFKQNGTWISLQNSYAINSQLAFQMNLDILGVDDSSMSNMSPGFFNQFRTNDRIYGGLSYVF
jgi:hypothetical protein